MQRAYRVPPQSLRRFRQSVPPEVGIAVEIVNLREQLIFGSTNSLSRRT